MNKKHNKLINWKRVWNIKNKNINNYRKSSKNCIKH